MKLKRFIALFLIVVMATTVVSTAGVLAAPKAAAQPTTTTYTPTVWYKPGKTTVFLPWQYNFRFADFNMGGSAAAHNEWAKWATAYSSIKGTQVAFAWSESGVGVNWQLKGITASQLAGKTCTITITESYKLAAQASTKGVSAELGTVVGCKDNNPHTWQGYATDDIAYGTAAGAVITHTKTFTNTFPLSKVCYYDAATNTLYGSAASSVGCTISQETGQATASTTVYAITVTFN